MKVSIIIPSYNVRGTIGNALDSVLSQTYKDIECIVVDGASKDGTAELLKEYSSKIKYISEKDHGPFDALNKGIKLATGDLIGWLGADDFYASPEVVEKAVQSIEKNNADMCWGDLAYVTKENPNKIVRFWKSSQYVKGAFKKGWQLPHFTSFVKRDVFTKYGYFRDEFKIAADYDLFLRFLEKNDIKSVYIPGVSLKAFLGGQSNVSFKNIIKGNIECYRAWSRNGLKMNPLRVFLMKPFRKIRQYYSIPNI